MLLSAYNIVYYLLSLSFTVILCIKIRPVHGLALKKTQKKGGKYINKLLRLQPAKLKVENKRRKEKIYGFAERTTTKKMNAYHYHCKRVQSEDKYKMASVKFPDGKSIKWYLVVTNGGI